MKKFSFQLFKKLPTREKKITISTMLTLLRFVLIPFIVGSMILHHWYAAFLLFLIAVITDILDGWTARWLNERTFLGAALDPLADKILVIAVFATLAFYQSPLFSIPRWFVALVLIKELIQIIGAIIIYAIKGYLTIAPTVLGKLTMVVQSAFITWLFSCYFFHWVPIKTYFVMLASVSILVLFTFIDYARIGWAQVRG
ncbi:MAG: CDP-diacylglycerol--glycerol-3-phosphate 3-phosphatidyltransferase [Candidatus Babeliales bacterium]